MSYAFFRMNHEAVPQTYGCAAKHISVMLAVEGRTMNVGEICSRRPITASASASLEEVARLMFEKHVGAVILTRVPGDRAVAAGILTDRDIVCAQIEHGGDLGSVPAARHMTQDPLSFSENERVEDALGRMRSRGVRRAIVLDESGALVGLLSVDDIVLRLVDQVAAIGRLLETQAVHSA
jgi:CBS domain-containing protein